MYEVNQDFLDYINNPNNIGRTIQNKVVIDGVDYFSDSLKTNPKIKQEATSFIGGFPSKTCEFEILNLDGTLTLNNKEVTVYKGEVINGTTTWIPMGIFKALDPNIINNESTKSIKFNGNDRAILFDAQYTSQLDWTTGHTGLEIVQEICTTLSITLETTGFAFAAYTFTSKPNFPENTTYREVIARIAEIGGEIASISRTGGLVIAGQKLVCFPAEYQQVEYIESTRTQYIDTGVNADYKLSVLAEIAILGDGAMGAIKNLGSSQYVRHHFNYNTSQGIRYYYMNGASNTTQLFAAGTEDTNKHRYLVDIYNSKKRVDSANLESLTTRDTFDSELNYWIFRRNSNASNLRLNLPIKLYSFKMYYENVLVRDFVPCYRKSDNEIGLYDLVNGVFYTNDGTGTFSKGADVQTLNPIGKEKRISLTKEPLYGAINTVALGKANIDDDIIYPPTIETDRITWRIEDNPFVDLIREEIIEEVASHIIGMSITPFTIKGFVDDFIYDLNDVISVIDNDGNTFNGVLLKYETENRIRSNVGAEAQTEKLVNHDIAGSTKKTIERVSLQVNHNTQQIELLATKTEELENEITESTTTILQDAEAIIMQALTDYVTTGDLETLQETISTQFEQTSQAFQFQFSNVYSQINNIDGAIQEEINERIKYIRFEDGNIIIGVAGNELILKQSNDRISFLQGENEVAYFSNNKLYVTDGEFLNSLKIGRFQWLPRQNGNLGLVFVGGDS